MTTTSHTIGQEKTDKTNLQPKVFVLTLNWNGKKWLGDCLTSILEMDYPNYEVVVIDNGSTDGSVDFVRENFPNVHLVLNGENLGYSEGFNQGIRYAHQRGADYFLIMNNDTVIDKNALSALMETALTQNKAGFVTGKVYYYDQPDTLQTIGKNDHKILWNGSHVGFKQKDIGQYQQVKEFPFLDDIFVLVSKKLYQEVGGYNPQFFLEAEEYEWQARSKEKGWKFYYTPKAKIWHRVSMSMGGSGNVIARYFDIRNGILVMALHAGLVRFLKYYAYISWEVISSLVIGIPAKIIRPRLQLKYRWAGFMGFCAGTLWLLHRKPARRVPFVIRMLRKGR
ncbi:glycosyltransferase [Candidatus Poribacteria bacterium]|nr:glycosyltransferase [Candidatus Poribacteria bacterium]